MDEEAVDVKRLRLTIALVLIFAALVAYALIYERGPREEEGGGDVVVIQEIARENLLKVEIDESYERVALAVENGEWFIAEPIKARTAKYTVESLLDAVCKFEAERKLLDKLEDPAEFGFDRPSRIITATLEGGEKKVLKIGGKTPLDEKYYVMREGDEAVYVVSGYNVTPLEKKFDDLRDKSIAGDFEKDDVVSVAVRSGKFEKVCVRREEKEEPEKAEADAAEDKAAEDGEEEEGETEEEQEEEPPEWHLGGRPEADCGSEADSILSGLSFTDAEGFVDEPGAPSEYGLDTPRHELVVTFKDGTDRRFETGKDKGLEVYLKNVSRNEIYLVEYKFVEKLEALKKAAAKL